jgi:hypothetical protein
MANYHCHFLLVLLYLRGECVSLRVVPGGFFWYTLSEQWNAEGMRKGESGGMGSRNEHSPDRTLVHIPPSIHSHGPLLFLDSNSYLGPFPVYRMVMYIIEQTALQSGVTSRSLPRQCGKAP